MQQPLCTRPLPEALLMMCAHVCVCIHTHVHTCGCISFVRVHVCTSHISQRCAGKGAHWAGGVSPAAGSLGLRGLPFLARARAHSAIRPRPALRTLTGGSGPVPLCAAQARVSARTQSPRSRSPEGWREVRPQRALGSGLEGSALGRQPSDLSRPQGEPVWPGSRAWLDGPRSL